MLYCPSVYMTHDKDAPKPRNPPTELRDGLRNLRCYYRPEYTMVISSSREARDLDWLGAHIVTLLRCFMCSLRVYGHAGAQVAA